MIDIAMTQKPGDRDDGRNHVLPAILGRGARATVDKAMDLAGGGSFLRKNALERLFRDVQGVRYHPLQEKPQNVLAGRFGSGCRSRINAISRKQSCSILRRSAFIATFRPDC